MEVKAFVDRVLAAAKAAGIDPAEVSVSAEEAFKTRVRKGAMEDYQVSDRVNLVLRGRVNGRIGTASTRAFDEESIGMLVRGASLSGRGSEILMRIDRVGRTMTMGQGMCGSLSGSVPTNVGQPTIRVSRLTVGGK